MEKTHQSPNIEILERKYQQCLNEIIADGLRPGVDALGMQIAGTVKQKIDELNSTVSRAERELSKSKQDLNNICDNINDSHNKISELYNQIKDISDGSKKAIATEIGHQLNSICNAFKATKWE